MVEEIEVGREFFAQLEREDEAIAARVKAGGCAWCEGPLYRSDYDRKPRGAFVAGAAEEFVVRHSLCCGREGCRRRSTPPSLRFLSRRVYVGAVVIVASMVALALKAAGAIRKATGVPARTTRRWLGWWQVGFVQTEVFVAVAARLVGVSIDALPTSIVERLPGTTEQRLRTMLDLLAPITTTSVVDGARFLRARS